MANVMYDAEAEGIIDVNVHPDTAEVRLHFVCDVTVIDRTGQDFWHIYIWWVILSAVRIICMLYVYTQLLVSLTTNNLSPFCNLP